jgi:hypothetical protein
MNVTLRSVTLPDFGDPGDQPEISASIYETRAKAAYRKAGTDWLVVYASWRTWNFTDSCTVD